MVHGCPHLLLERTSLGCLEPPISTSEWPTARWILQYKSSTLRGHNPMVWFCSRVLFLWIRPRLGCLRPHRCSALSPFLPYFSTPLTGFIENSPSVNHMVPNPYLRLCFWKTPPRPSFDRISAWSYKSMGKRVRCLETEGLGGFPGTGALSAESFCSEIFQIYRNAQE